MYNQMPALRKNCFLICRNLLELVKASEVFFVAFLGGVGV